MAIVGGFDVHRVQITFDYLDTDTGEASTGQIRPATRAILRRWLAERFAAQPDVAFAVEGCTGWRFVVEELTARRSRGPPRRARRHRDPARTQAAREDRPRPSTTGLGRREPAPLLAGLKVVRPRDCCGRSTLTSAPADARAIHDPAVAQQTGPLLTGGPLTDKGSPAAACAPCGGEQVDGPRRKQVVSGRIPRRLGRRVLRARSTTRPTAACGPERLHRHAHQRQDDADQTREEQGAHHAAANDEEPEQRAGEHAGSATRAAATARAGSRSRRWRR